MPTPPASEFAMSFASPEPTHAPLYSQPQAYSNMYSLPSPDFQPAYTFGEPTVDVAPMMHMNNGNQNNIKHEQNYDDFSIFSRNLPALGGLSGMDQQLKLAQQQQQQSYQDSTAQVILPRHRVLSGNNGPQDASRFKLPAW